MRIGLLTLIAAGCSFRASYDGTHYKCGEGDVCPSGQTCVAGECIAGTFDAPINSPDAPPGTPDAPSSNPDAMMVAGKCGTLAVLRDDFSTDRYGTTWDKWSDGGPTATVTGGHLSISIPANGSDLGAGYAGNFYYDFTGSEARATITQVADVDTILEVRDYRGGKIQMVVENGILFAGVFGNVATQGDRAMVTYDPQVHKQWRLREQGGNAYWEWSTDGSAWNELWHEADPIKPLHVIVELAADGNGPSEARFEELNVGAPLPPGLCGASSIVDDFSASQFDTKWSTWADSPHATISATTSAAVITNDGTADYWGGFQTRHLFDLRNDTFYVDATTIPQQKPFVGWAEAMVPGDGGTRLEVNVEGTGISFLQKVNDTVKTSVNATYDPVAHRYWRFRANAAGTMVYIDTSPDAATWTPRLEASALLDPSAIMFVMGGGEYSGGASPTSQVERFGGINTP